MLKPSSSTKFIPKREAQYESGRKIAARTVSFEHCLKAKVKKRVNRKEPAEAVVCALPQQVCLKFLIRVQSLFLPTIASNYSSLLSLDLCFAVG